MAAAILLSVLPLISGASSFVTVEMDANRVWWFKHGNVSFFSRGINHVNNGGQDDGVGGRDSVNCKRMTGSDLCGDSLSFSKDLMFSPYFNSTQARYGSEQAWANNTADRMASWGFNTVGGWSATVVERAATQRGLYYTHMLDMGTTWLNHWGLDFDVWSTNYTEQCERIASAQVAKRARDEYLIGYQLDNELDYKNLNITYWLPMATPGGAKAAQFLAIRYNNSIGELNAAWKIKASSFSDVKNHLQGNQLDWAAVQRDNIPWLGVMQEQYLKVAVGAIKKYDPHHLILGMRGQNSGFWGYPEGILTFPGLLKAMIPYIDVFDFHTYEDLPEMEYMAEIHAAIGKPILLGEFSFIAWDSNLPNGRGARSCTWKAKPPKAPNCSYVRTTQNERSDGFTQFVTTLAAAPFAVGYHWWQWADEPGGSGGRWPDGENSNYGLVHLDDDAYGLLTEEMARTNAKIDAIHG